MSSSRSTERPLVSLRYETVSAYQTNLLTLLSSIAQTPLNALVVAPEVCLTNFDYDRFDEAADFAEHALERLFAHLDDRILVLTVIERRDDGIYNVAKVMYQGKVIHEQAKARLFKFGGEHSHFKEGVDDAIVLFEVEGIRLGVLICFELRFKSLWQRLEGADVIAIPAQWGRLRSKNFVVLTEALAVMNQCYVVASDTSNEEMTGQSGVISPFGVAYRNGEQRSIVVRYKKDEVRKMRRYLDVGIDA